MTDFMTTEYVKQESEKGELAALKCSLLHHEQGRDADKVGLIIAIKDEKFGVRGDFCACCQRNIPDANCGKDTACPLKEKKESCCGGKWDILCSTFDLFEYDYSNANFKAFQEAEAELCKYIEGKIKECEAKECKCKCKALDKPEVLRHGDLVKWHCDGGLYVALNDSGTLRWYSMMFNHFIGDITQDRSDYTILGNLKEVFDDLAAMGEPLEGFERHDLKAKKADNRFGFKINRACIDYEGDNYVSLNLEEIEETILNLRRMVVKLKTK